MTQATASTPLHVILTPMQLPEAVPIDALTHASLQVIQQQTGARLVNYPGDVSDLLARLQPTLQASASNERLLLHPGETSELVIQLQNRGDRPMQVQVRLDGNFPLEWLATPELNSRLLETEIAPRQQAQVELRLQPPADFFEQMMALLPEGTLDLDYECFLRIRYSGGSDAVDADRDQPITYRILLHLRPHSLYLDFLPNIYRESDFTSRFLAIFEQAFEPAVQTLDVLWAHLDPLTAPAAMLPFLAYWVGFPVDPRWTETKQRRLIRRAIEIYQWRGTKRGLRLYLHLYTDLPLDDDVPDEADKHISITELASSGFVLSNSDLGERNMLGGGRPFHFIVRLRPVDADQLIDEDLVRQIINREKPAFSTYDLLIESAD